MQRVIELLMKYQSQLLSLTAGRVVCYVSCAISGDIIESGQELLECCCDKEEHKNGRQSNFFGFDRESRGADR